MDGKERLEVKISLHGDLCNWFGHPALRTPPCTPDPALNNPAHMPISPGCSAVPSRQETAQKRRVNSHSSKCFMMARQSASSYGRLAIGKRHSGSRVAS